jgi:hypothetical protein
MCRVTEWECPTVFPDTATQVGSVLGRSAIQTPRMTMNLRRLRAQALTPLTQMINSPGIRTFHPGLMVLSLRRDWLQVLLQE